MNAKLVYGEWPDPLYFYANVTNYVHPSGSNAKKSVTGTVNIDIDATIPELTFVGGQDTTGESVTLSGVNLTVQ